MITPHHSENFQKFGKFKKNINLHLSQKWLDKERNGLNFGITWVDIKPMSHWDVKSSS